MAGWLTGSGEFVLEDPFYSFPTKPNKKPDQFVPLCGSISFSFPLLLWDSINSPPQFRLSLSLQIILIIHVFQFECICALLLLLLFLLNSNPQSDWYFLLLPALHSSNLLWRNRISRPEATEYNDSALRTGHMSDMPRIGFERRRQAAGHLPFFASSVPSSLSCTEKLH